ncbi:MAG: hypothetical protein R3F11_33225, partial [Verrucomicrobiales bacterium]
SPRFRLLEEFAARATGQSAPRKPAAASHAEGRPFFDGVQMLDAARLLRRLTLSLGARLPTAGEKARVEADGDRALPAILDALMEEEAFYDRLAEAFNDIFLTPGISDNAETVLSYEHFEKTRLWYQKWEFKDIEGEKERERAGWELARQYREAIEGEPMAMVKYIVRENHPFTEIIDADYIMVTPFSARGYGVFDEVRDRFKNPDDYLEYVPVKLKALKGRSRATDQESATGFYPHAGLLSTFQYLMRYPTTETNRNRLRVRMYFQHFLGIDVMQIAPRVNDAAAITAKYEVPTMQAADCVVCHKLIDPVAGLFQDYYAVDAKGVYQRRKDGWFTDMFPPGFEGEALPDPERWRAPMAGRTHRQGPALCRRDGRARLVSPRLPPPAAPAGGHRGTALRRPPARLPRAARRHRAHRPRFRGGGIQLQGRRQGLGALALLPRGWIGGGGRSGAARGARRPRRGAAAHPGATRTQDRRDLWQGLGAAARSIQNPLRRHRYQRSHRAPRRTKRRDGRDPAHDGQ